MLTAPDRSRRLDQDVDHCLLDPSVAPFGWKCRSLKKWDQSCPTTSEPAVNPLTMEDFVLSLLAWRSGRQHFFGDDLFCDPAWDILLQLFLARLNSVGLTLAELSRALDLPNSVTSRWLTALSEQGLVAECERLSIRSSAWFKLRLPALRAMQCCLEDCRSTLGMFANLSRSNAALP